MKAEMFAAELAKLAPTAGELKQLGLSKREAEEERRTFQCIRRERPFEVQYAPNELLSLLSGWDASTIEIGVVSFLKRPTNKENGLLVGHYEDDLLVMGSDGEVFVEDAASEGHIMLRAAKDGDRFLDALMLAAQFSEGDDDAARAVAKECAVAAGGNKYLSFYRNLLGVP